MYIGIVLFQVSLSLVAIVVHVHATEVCLMNESNYTDVVRFPFMTSIHAKQGDRNVPFCGGSILNPRWILTAGQCLVKDKKNLNTLKDRKEMLVTVGMTVMSSFVNANDKDVYRPRKLVVHPEMKIRFPQYDLGMILLEKKIAMGMKVATVPMVANEDAGYPEGKLCTIVSWGVGGQTKKSLAHNRWRWDYGDQPLKFFHVNMVAAETCDYGLPIGSEGSILCSECAGKSEYPCMGDIGAPLICEGRQVGVVSWSKSCKSPDIPVVHTRINTMQDWIDQQVNSHNAAQEKTTSIVWFFIIIANLCTYQ